MTMHVLLIVDDFLFIYFFIVNDEIPTCDDFGIICFVNEESFKLDERAYNFLTKCSNNIL